MKRVNVYLLSLIILTIFFCSCSSKKQDAVEYKNHIDETIKEVDNLLAKDNLSSAYKLVQEDINSNYALRDNYFVKSGGITEPDDKEYFGGEYIKKIQEFKKLSEQIIYAEEDCLLFDNEKSVIKKYMNGYIDYDKTKITDERVRKALIVSAKKRAVYLHNKDLIETYTVVVQKNIESFIRNNSTLGIVGVKDALVERMNLKVISHDIINNDYGSGFNYVLEGVYNHKGSDFNVKCELETAGMVRFYSTVKVTQI